MGSLNHYSRYRLNCKKNCSIGSIGFIRSIGLKEVVQPIKPIQPIEPMKLIIL